MANPSGIGALSAPSSFAPSEGAEISQAIGQYPQIMQAEQLQQAQGQQQLGQYAQENLTRLMQIASVNPGVAASPQWMNEIKKNTGIMGIPVPMKQDGSGVDLSALGMSTYKQADLMSGLDKPPQVRAMLFPFASDSYKNAPVTPNFTGTGMADMLKGVQSTVDLFEKGSMTPESYGQTISMYRDLGLGSSLDHLLTPEVLNAGASKLANAQMEKITSLIGHTANEDEYRNALLKDTMDKFYASLSEKHSVDQATIGVDAARIAHMQNQDADKVAALQIQTQRLSDDEIKLKAYVANVGSEIGSRRIASFNATAKPIIDNYNKTETHLQVVQGEIATAVRDGKPVDSNLLDQAASLKQQLDNMKGIVNQAKFAEDHAFSALAHAVTGNKVNPVGKNQVNIGGAVYTIGQRFQAIGPDKKEHTYEATAKGAAEVTP